jgi:predicted permease
VLHRLRSQFSALFGRHGFESGMGEELRFHMDQYVEDLVQSGVPLEEARRRARLEFGGMNTVADECRQARGLAGWDILSGQLRYCFRTLRNSPGFAAAALATIALCLGANLTIFAVIDAVLLRSLPFPEGDRLVSVYNTYPKAGVDRDGSSITNYYERRGRLAAFGSISIYRFATGIVGESGLAKHESVTQVSPEFFKTLAVGPAFGRVFREAETSYQTDQVAILSNEFWRDHLQADPHAIGRQVRLDGHPKTVVGVLPPGFQFLSSKAALYVPLASSPEQRTPHERHSGGNVTQMIGRLKPGASLALAQTQVDSHNAALEADNPDGKMMAEAGFRSVVLSLQADYVASVRPMLVLLQGAVLLLLLIGIVNLANLLLIRATARAKEMAMRQALGASSARVFSEAILETSVLSGTGAILGLIFAAVAIHSLGAIGVERLPFVYQLRFNSHLAMAGLAAALTIGLALALPVAWFHLRRSADVLRSETRSATSGRAAQKLRFGFQIAQIALTFVLLAGAALLSLSLKRVMMVSPGFQPDHLISAEISLVGNKYPGPPSGLQFAERLGSPAKLLADPTRTASAGTISKA